jgi:hypothetical protein
MCAVLSFARYAVTSILYLDMLEENLVPLLKGEGSDDATSPIRVLQYFHKEVTDLLNSMFPEE